MANQKIILNVPTVDLQNGTEIDVLVFNNKTADFRNSIMSTIRFGKNFTGNAYIIIPHDDAKELIGACAGAKPDDDGLDNDDLDVIREISNVILNTLIGEFGNLLDVKLEFSFPDVEFAIVNTVENSDLSEDMHFLTMFTSFLLSESKAKGMIFVALSTDSETMLIDKINEMLVEINE
jgi:chemotaxis protein CheC